MSVVSFSTLTVLFQRFTQYLASNNCSFNLGQFIDKQGVQGKERERERRERRERYEVGERDRIQEKVSETL